MLGHFTATNGAEIKIRGTWSAMTIQAEGGRDDAPSVTIKARTQQNTNYEDIAAIKLADYSVVTAISENGLYMVDLTGLDFIKFTFTAGEVYYNVV